MKLSYAMVALSVLSVSAYADLLNYTVTNPGVIVNCKAKPAGVGLCRNTKPTILASSTGVYNTSTGQFTVNNPGEPSISLQFSNNVANQNACAEIHSPLIVEPISYCQVSSNYFALLSIAANLNASNQVAMADTNITENMGGWMSVNYTLKGTTFTLKN